MFRQVKHKKGETMKINKLEIENFKGLEKFKAENMAQVTQAHGDNRAGKTSLTQALSFIFEGTARQGKKWLRDGETKGFAFIDFINKEGKHITIKRFLPTGVMEMWEDGKNITDNKALKKYVGLNSFSPEKFLDPKERAKAFSSLIKKEFEWPKELLYYREKSESKPFLNIEFEEKNGVSCLNLIRSKLEDYRRITGKEKRDKIAYQKEVADQLTKQMVDFKEAGFNIQSPPNLETLLLEKAKIEENRDKKEQHDKDIFNTKESVDKKIKLDKDLNKQLADLKLAIQKNEIELKQEKSKLAELEKQTFNIGDDTKINQTIKLCREFETLEPLKERVKEADKVAKALKEDYEIVDNFLQKAFNNLYAVYVKEIKDKIPGISFSNGWKYEGNPIDSLSSSEAMRLGLAIIKALSNSPIIVIDNSELFDEATAKSLDLNGKGTSYLLTKVGEAFDIPSGKIKMEAQND